MTAKPKASRTHYYRLVAPSRGAYGLTRDGVILAINEKRSWLLTSEWCGNRLDGACYRHHVNYVRRPWPRTALEWAIDRTKAYAKAFGQVDPKEVGTSRICQELGIVHPKNRCRTTLWSCDIHTL